MASDKQSPHQIHLQHFAHEHLLLYEDAAYFAKYKRCFMCSSYIEPSPDSHNDGDGDGDGDGGFYCKECYQFYAHKSCGEAPRYIHNSLHPMHPLELCERERNIQPYKCSFCEEPIYEFGYKCSSSSTTTVCDVKLHIKCATKNIFAPKDHQHSFVNLKPTLFTCNGCGIDEDTKCFSCMCSICQLQLHPKCRNNFPLSAGVRQRLHDHVLKLCFSFEIGFDFSNKLCKICSNKMNNVLCLYQCNKGCAYIAHATCATSKGYLIQKFDHEEICEYELRNTLLEEVELEEIDTEPEEVITHFSHPGHSLILSNIEPTYEAGYVCHGCVRPIISAPFYKCDREKCNFFLHKQCSQLPKTIQSPLHRHPLVLKDFLDLYAKIIFCGFTCDACQVQCNGFSYECLESGCNISFDVGCTLLGDTLNHASHEHTLTLVSTIPNKEKRCIACDSPFSDAFWCEDCNFFLDLKCAAFPIVIGHDCPTGNVWTVKPLKLTYNCIEHAGGQYYCDLCGETRGKDLWFYNCEDCRDSIHPQCLLGDARLMYGKSFNIDGHCHTVCVAKNPKNDPLCGTCGKPCQHSPLAFCPTCKVYFHDDNIFTGGCTLFQTSGKQTIREYCCIMSSIPHANDEEEEEVDDGEIAITSEIVKHFTHPHNLVIGEYDPKRSYGKVCDGCGMQITGPFYTCADKKGKCNFFLHRECFELPKQIQHPLHRDHPLFLNSFLALPYDDEVGFICYGCDECSNCFVYSCLACKFFLDVRCSLLSDTHVHESHPSCTLTLIDKKIELAKGERKCEACNSDCSSCKYICEVCNFELGLRCVSLPKEVMHECSEYGRDIRLQHLVYEDESKDLKYCGTCIETWIVRIERIENEWYYYCKDCDCSSQLRCANTFRRDLIKSGIVYQAYNHFHNLITEKIKYNRLEKCIVCKHIIYESHALYCEKCDFYFHVKCCLWLKRA